jgi:AcrR family transcriptional regulator
VADSVWFSKPKPGGGQHLGLSRELIVAKAIQVLDEEGLAKLSMRKLASELGAAPMSLYWHVPTKDALLELCMDHPYSELEPADEGVEWDVAMRGLMHSLRQLALRHPWWLKLIGGSMSIGPNAVAMSNSMLERMRDAGLSVVEAARSASTMSSYVIGFAMAEVNHVDAGADYQIEVPEILALYGERFPYYAEVLTEAELWSLDKQFDYGLECVLAGIKSRLAVR